MDIAEFVAARLAADPDPNMLLHAVQEALEAAVQGRGEWRRNRSFGGADFERDLVCPSCGRNVSEYGGCRRSKSCRIATAVLRREYAAAAFAPGVGVGVAP